ncbi:MAG TPA: ABC transporter substrate-binding protein [Stellaceae bacterium]|nr:ABC transporter substrate-binding protein [Stellaceae bacterium]
MRVVRYLSIALAGLALAAFATGTTLAAEPSAGAKALAAAADKEGSLNVMWGEGTLGGLDGLGHFQDQINAAYGTHLKFTFTPGPSMPAMGNQIATMIAAGQPSPSDIYIAYVRTMATLAPRHMFLKADWTSLGVPADAVEEDGTMVRLVSALPGILYNTQKVPYKPESLSDFLKPEWKGKIASTPYVANFDILASNIGWGPERALDFANKVSPNLAGLLRCDEPDRLASGEFIAYFITCTGNDADDLIKKGAPLAQVVPRDFAVLGYFYLSVPTNAPHPNAAKLFVAHALTPEGQKLVYDDWGSDLDLLPGSRTHERILKVEKDYGVKMERFTVADELNNKAGNEAWTKIGKIIGDQK